MGSGNRQQSAKAKGGNWQQSGKGKGGKGNAEAYGNRWSPQDVWTLPASRYAQPVGGGLNQMMQWVQDKITEEEKIAWENAAKEATKSQVN
eukprot:TRINITY_DN11091_c0_g2_i1.p3 TRINITY_DN11091_c0_g2~~TRINITY_DN11091_c0_g2_i1.p3  ORF type:complete len:105 (-),score=23.93 TRINITY_DN11091_c0_g2_i1:665-937(-)